MNDALAADWECPPTEAQKKTETPWLPLVQDGADIAVEELPPVIEIVEGIVAEQSKLVIASGSKSFKTWLTIDMAVCVALGLPFLGRKTTRSRVLYVNLELKGQTFKRRLQTIAKAKGITIDRDWFLHLPLRGKLAGWRSVSEIIFEIIQLAKHYKATVVIIDPTYKLNFEGDENNTRDQTRLFNELDRITIEAESTLILNDHFSKGNQSEKDPLDAIRGSSAKGGDVDAAMILRKHDTEDCFRVDMVHRELPPVAEFCIGWKYPFFQLRPDLDPADMKRHTRGGNSQFKQSATPENVLALVPLKRPIRKNEVIEALKKRHVHSSVRPAVDKCVEDKKTLFVWEKKRKGTQPEQWLSRVEQQPEGEWWKEQT